MEQSLISTYQEAYAAVLKTPYWYGDRPKLLKEAFNAANTEKRANIVVDILRRAARRKSERRLSEQYLSLADKLSGCRPARRCGSSACLTCLRAFQQAKAVAHHGQIFQLAEKYPTVLWCLVTIIPRESNYSVGSLGKFAAGEFNDHLKAVLTPGGIARPFLGSVDFSLETSRIGKYWQPHWHFTLHTDDPQLLREELKDLFPPIVKYDYPVDVKEISDLHCLPYIHKVIKIKELLEPVPEICTVR
jgi:hypothetical protein